MIQPLMRSACPLLTRQPPYLPEEPKEFFADLKKRDPAVTSVYAAEEVAHYLRSMVSEMDKQGGEGGYGDKW